MGLGLLDDWLTCFWYVVISDLGAVYCLRWFCYWWITAVICVCFGCCRLFDCFFVLFFTGFVMCFWFFELLAVTLRFNVLIVGFCDWLCSLVSDFLYWCRLFVCYLVYSLVYDAAGFALWAVAVISCFRVWMIVFWFCLCCLIIVGCVVCLFWDTLFYVDFNVLVLFIILTWPIAVLNLLVCAFDYG